MLLFWLLCILLLVIASLALIVPVLRNRQVIEADRDSLNKTLYKGRVKEIEQDVEQGLVAEQAAVLTELQQNLLEDVVEAKSSAQRINLTLLLLPGIILFFGVCIGLYLQYGAGQQVSHWQSVMTNYEALQHKMTMQDGQPPSKQEVDDFMLALRTHLANQPDDTQGWLMLGRLAFALRDGQLAQDALHKAYKLSPADSHVRVAYAQALLQTEDVLKLKQAENLIIATVGLEPDNIPALSVYAFMALQQEDFAGAIERWRKILPLLAPSSERYGMVKNSIAYAQQQLAKANEAKKGSPAGSMTYQVKVTINEQVDLPETGYLFVFAQMVNGPKMPLAAKKLPLSEFPATVTLSDADAMMPELKLSQQAEFIIKARISNDENVAVAAGEWEGESSVIKSGQKGVIEIAIDHKI
ncbi:c-type cytochrome biogenesis protein CcmI [Motilimonas sp. 1_MG-2023]|uniref:c-type cytochrome biogenesis protein CcmI n=1 Tax=Motilimonas sp. 1_MG-2023 TaxID=3062672 RepID=UPI0026E1440F|nr:c-type cytochrome biogenesis protein CcmI [Motilimonas sp. 1_MG-2023]MDO6525014.1 c-type cytochrome biogenesis protein CcmI [Motilimonas sp. 1_MG-2023]